MIKYQRNRECKILLCFLAFPAMLLAGCSTFSRDGGFDDVKTVATKRLQKEVAWVRSEKNAKEVQATVRKLLASPLTADTAVQIALLNNRGLQAAYAELGIAEADLVQAGRLRNPGFSFARKHRADDVEIERTFLFDLLGLVTMPLRTDLERRRFELTKQRVASEVMRAAADARRAYFNAVAAQQAVKYMEKVRTAAEITAELARRMAATGNFNKLDQARERAFYAGVTARVARTRQMAVTRRERLTVLMGLWGDDMRFVLPERLPDLPGTVQEFADLEQRALKQRLDVQAAMKEAENTAASLGLTKVTGFVNVVEVGYLRNDASGLPRQMGYQIGLELPIFDWGGARVARAEHTYMQAVNRAADIAVRARSEVRESYSAYRTAFDLAKHYRDEIVPLQKKISDENVLRYNGMLISVFELLADAREQILAISAYIEAVRDYWLAETTFQLAMTGTSPHPMDEGESGMRPVASGSPRSSH